MKNRYVHLQNDVILLEIRVEPPCYYAINAADLESVAASDEWYLEASDTDEDEYPAVIVADTVQDGVVGQVYIEDVIQAGLLNRGGLPVSDDPQVLFNPEKSQLS